MAADSGPALERMPVDRLKRVGPRMLERLQRLRIRSVQDLLFHLPYRYQDRSRLHALRDLCDGDEALVEGVVADAQISQGRRRSLKVWLCDDGGSLMLRFFHFTTSQLESMGPGQCLRCFGEVRQGPQSLEMVHPEVQHRFDAGTVAVGQAMTPVYPSTEGMQQVTWRGLTDQALALLRRDPRTLHDWVPAQLLAPLHLPPLGEALVYLHRPPPEAPLEQLAERAHPAFLRLAFEEMLAHQLALRRLRRARRRLRAPPLNVRGDLRRQLLRGLPFGLTGAQQRVLDEIAADLGRSEPMMRLLQGDVGSGKTVVAALAALQAVEAGFQAAIMAPTELLSEQHLRNLSRWLAPLGVSVAWLSGRHKGAERRGILADIAGGDAAVVVGTHALFQDEVRFHRLGLAMIDEQHRFGVHQRLRLRGKGEQDGLTPHQLIMTATPIPRSLAMAVYADLDLSVIDELPPGRTPISTVAVPDTRRDEVIERVRTACAAGRQAYWVCTLVEESEALQAQAAEDTAAALRESLPELRVGLVHGRIKAADREPVMQAFAAGELDLLVATTVIEVGVDVPNASLMIIENPERLGLAQLHQLRGRVGRGTVQSYCLLLYHPPLGATARERLGILRKEVSGFAIADADLRLRGAGEVLGTRQAGMAQFRLADPLRDQALMQAAQQGADRMLEHWPEHVEPLIHRWLGEREECGQV
ncbi:ATP-dependent DNA helicase RecG [Thiohalocapsa marina]|uniref:ATP-dependent DNA helicase RecG n=1 Tax=Thiohalocapsa marina TaxID=424902 RepID=A0A5M8FH31_9GAMM|nr:ATP-dependent DNA helicase RecG [Thiohalocapsa marina]KAA6183240.1 ATP-dependent DNA helicase RecG [Thiohalocapsa marina]